MGSCWAFGMTATLESALIKAINYTNPDFSENNMQNTMLIYTQNMEIGYQKVEITEMLWLIF